MAAVATPVPGPGDRAAQIEDTMRFLQAELQQAKANLAQAQTQLLQNQEVKRGAEVRARMSKLAELQAQMMVEQAEVERRRAQLAQSQNPPPTTFDTIPVRPEPMVIPTPMAQRFEGRTLRSIRLAGIGLPTEAFLAQAQVPIREGDALTQASIEATIAAIRKFDEHLGERWTTVEPNGMDLTIFAPGAISAPGGRSARGGGIGAGIGGGIGAGIGGGIGAGVGGGLANVIEGIEFATSARFSFHLDIVEAVGVPECLQSATAG
jgi:hypothetical protein